MRLNKQAIFAAIAPVVFTMSSASAWAHGDVKCTTEPKEKWRPHTELEAKLVKEGWQIRRMEKTTSCYEVYAKDPKGKRVEAFFNPVTFERVEE
ncbi:cytochrome b [Undibacterium sp. KW1]|uniref:PepSY domain-containing protein n=1 Tax=Undibacterium sp. KW1 TaxID=2058624 RepID=UPI001331CF03|nr:PepSY domain-containing protein [Undibacterium sp. KW1]BBB61247.1 cytochrome b [Undibacterium sp. KW1]